MFKNTNSKKMTALLVALVLVTSLFVGGTIARYVTSTSSEDSARVAVWGINADDVTMDLFNATYELPDGTVVAQSNDGDNIIAPGTSRDNYFSIVNTDDNLAPEVMYEVRINLDDSEIDPLILNNPSIQWRLDDGAYGTWEETKAQVLALSGHESGVKTYAPGELADEFKAGVTHTIGWTWLMDNNNDEMDTEMGNAAVDGDIIAKIIVNVTAVQTDVDSTGMLEGNGSVYDINNPTPLVFRSSAPADELVEVKVGNETLTKNSDYTVDSGSTIITLTETCISRLGAGNHIISIISQNMTAKASFSIAEVSETPVALIPEGATYYSNVEVIKEPIMDDMFFDTYQIGYYPNATKLEAGEAFPTTPQTGDAYIYGDYEYRYNVYLEYGVSYYMSTSLNGWGAFFIGDGEKETPDEFLKEINGVPVNSLSGAFAYRYNNITSAPVIHENIKRIDNAFNGCGTLTGTIEINATNLSDSYNNYESALLGTQITEITGTISDELKAKILATKE